jgi:hypothetical protein
MNFRPLRMWSTVTEFLRRVLRISLECEGGEVEMSGQQ